MYTIELATLTLVKSKKDGKFYLNCFNQHHFAGPFDTQAEGEAEMKKKANYWRGMSRMVNEDDLVSGTTSD